MNSPQNDSLSHTHWPNRDSKGLFFFIFISCKERFEWVSQRRITLFALIPKVYWKWLLFLFYLQ